MLDKKEEKLNNDFFVNQQKLNAEMSNCMTKNEFMEMMNNLRFTHIAGASITLVSNVIYNVDRNEVERKTYSINVR